MISNCLTDFALHRYYLSWKLKYVGLLFGYLTFKITSSQNNFTYRLLGTGIIILQHLDAFNYVFIHNVVAIMILFYQFRTTFCCLFCDFYEFSFIFPAIYNTRSLCLLASNKTSTFYIP